MDRKAIFITGAASGIGLAAAKLFAGKGWFVGLADIDKAGLASALKAIGPDNGQTYVLPAGAFFEIRDGKVARISNTYNLNDWIAQVGA